MIQLGIHKKINKFFEVGIQTDSVEVAKKILNSGSVSDTKNYFFSQANEDWLSWLWEKGFLNAIKEKGDNKVRCYMPELDYLASIAKKNSAKVAKIILSVQISEEIFNPEVINRFLWIISDMPAEQIKILAEKIRKERWVYLMREFNQSGFEFNKIVKKLAGAREHGALLEIAQAMLELKTKKETEEAKKRFSDAESFYLDHINEVGLFESLVNIGGSYAEKAFRLTTEVLAKIIKGKGKSKDGVFESGVFKYADFYTLYDADIFTLDFNRRSISSREDFESLVVVIKILIEKTFSKSCSDEGKVRGLFNTIDSLPENKLVWRLKMFALSQCPKIFKNEIKNAFFRVFEVDEKYFEIEGGAEYHQLLVNCFGVLDESDRREYIKKVFEYFGVKLKSRDREKWRKKDGGEILCFIKKHLTSGEKKEAKEKFGIAPDEAECVPKPVSQGVKSGMVVHKSPDDISKLAVSEIIERLKTDYIPEELNKKYEHDDFQSPRGAEGLGDAFKEDIKKRMNEYLKNINFFFDINNIHPHYLYSLLRGIEEMLRDKQSLSLEQVEQMFSLFGIIKDEGEKKPFKKKDDKSWLADWIGVHKVITDILLYILGSKEINKEIHKIHRKKIKDFISYLLTIQDSPSKEDEKPEYGEPFHIAINSVRGRAYQIFVEFVQNDGKKLANDTKDIFKKVLLDDSLAIRFVIGHYLAVFYFRDKEFIVDLLPQIFPKDEENKKDIYLATWEGYLINTLYSKLFDELKDYYEYAIKLNPKEYTERKYSKNLDEALAIHLGLAFAHLDLGIKDNLFDLFWGKPNAKRHREFISFIGRSCLTRVDAGDEWLKNNNVSKKKLINFWNWAIKNISDAEVLSGFGFWINENKEMLDDEVIIGKIAETLKKSDGNIDWDYGLLERLPVFAEKNGEKTLDVVSIYLLDSKGNLNRNRKVPLVDQNKIKDALEIIYKNGGKEMKQKATNLINTLIEKGSNRFWYLKEILK